MLLNSYVLQNSYERLYVSPYVRLSVRQYVRLSVRPYVRLYVLPNSYGHLYVLLNLHVEVKEEEEKRTY